MQIIIHRGQTEIGASCIEIQSASGTRIFVDAGLELTGEKAKLPQEIATADAVFISHAHPDHYGLVQGIKKSVPLYCGKITEGLFRVMGAFNYKLPRIKRSFCHFHHGEKICIGDMNITPYIADHSVPDAYAFLVEADGKRVFYSGDFRTTGRKPYSAERVLDNVKNVDALIIEGTCIEGRDSAIKTEQALQEEVRKILAETSVATFALTSSINVDRLVSFFKAARATRKIFVIDIYAALILWLMGKNGAKVPQMDWDNVFVLSREGISQKQRKSLECCFVELGMEDFRDKIYRDHKTVSLKKISQDPSKYLIKNSQIKNIMEACEMEKANVIYSMWSGYMKPDFDKHGNYEKMRNNPNINFHSIHTSGHAMKADLFGFIDKLAPKILIPFHTNAPEKFLEKYPEAIVGQTKISV